MDDNAFVEGLLHLLGGRAHGVGRLKADDVYGVGIESAGGEGAVKGDPAAIGYISLSMLSHEVKALLVDEEAPTIENIQKGHYALTRPFLFVTKGDMSPEARRFFEYVLSDEGQAILEEEGLVRKP